MDIDMQPGIMFFYSALNHFYSVVEMVYYRKMCAHQFALWDAV